MQIFDAWRGGIHLEARAFALAGERVFSRVRSGVGGHHFNHVAAIRQQARIEAVRFIGDLIAGQRLPIALAITAIEERVGQLVAVIVMRVPAHGHVAVSGRVASRSGSSAGILRRIGWLGARGGRRKLAGSLHFYLIHHRRHVLG